MMKNENFADIYNEYHRFSTRLAFRIVKDRGIAEDISQEVFYGIYKMGSRLDVSDERKLHGFISTATVNKSKDYLRKTYRKREIGAVDDSVMESFQDKNCDVEASILHMEKQEYYNLVLQRLRDQNRMNYDILMKVKCLGISPDIVAEEYGITRNNVNNRVLRTKTWLQNEMSKIYGD